MKNNKGISMITLVISIIVMLIILMIAYRVGIRYITQSKEEEKSALITIMSDAVERRQNDNYVGLSGETNYYSGYHIEEEEFTRISTLFDSTDFEYGPGLWYIVDAISADQLGVKTADSYLIKDVLSDTNDGSKYLAIADYYTGKVFLVKYAEVQIAMNIEDITHGSDGHVHSSVTVATCTEPSVCTECGKVVTQALGHTYNLAYSTCTVDRKCNRCGYVDEKATGHTYGTELDFDSNGHFHRCINIDRNTNLACNAPGDYEDHELEISQIEGPNWHHTISCRICAYRATEECNKAVKPKDLVQHIVYCTLCGKEELVEHDVIKYRYVDKYKHIVYCDTCKTDLREEEHVDDVSPYGVCDLCEGIIDISQKPAVESAVIINTTPTGVDAYQAKRGDTIRVTIRTNMVLGGAPTIRIQGIQIGSEDITNPDAKEWVATFSVSKYGFVDGSLEIEITNIRSLWGVQGDTVSETTDGKYVIYDSVRPTYIISE